jgi:hypothetical protein
MLMADSPDVLDWATDTSDSTGTIEPTVLAENAVPAIEPYSNKDLIFEDMILIAGEKKQMLLGKIEAYIQKGIKGKQVAHMISALRQLGYLPKICSERQLFTAIKAKYGQIGSEKGIYAYLEDIKVKQFQKEINDLASYFKVD